MEARASCYFIANRQPQIKMEVFLLGDDFDCQNAGLLTVKVLFYFSVEREGKCSVFFSVR